MYVVEITEPEVCVVRIVQRETEVYLVKIVRRKQTEQSYARQTEAGIPTSLPLWSRRPNHRACSTKMPPSQSYKRRCVACQHSLDNQTLQLQAGAGEDDVIHLPSGLDRVERSKYIKDNKLPQNVPLLNFAASHPIL